MKATSRFLAPLLACSLGVVAVAPLFAADTGQIAFDYRKTTAEQPSEYRERGLEILLSNVNTMDYNYTVSIEAVKPAPTQAGPVLGQRGAPADCPSQANPQLEKRLIAFGSQGLLAWKKAFATDKCPSGLFDFSDESLTRAGIYTLEQPAVDEKLAQTGAGGALIITVLATPSRSQVVDSADGSMKVVRAPLDPKDLSDKSLEATVRAHMEKRVFRVSFAPPQGIVFSFGPYLSSLDRQTFVRVAKPDSQTAFAIGLNEDSSVTYGVAAYWNADLWSLSKKWSLGVTWGVAYNLQNALDTAVAGLIGVSIRRQDTPVVFNLGAGVGRSTELAGGRAVGDPIGANEDIPTKNRTRLAFFAGVSFTVGGRR